MFSNVDLLNELLKTKEKHQRTRRLLMRQAAEIRKQGKPVDKYILSRLHAMPEPGNSNINLNLLEKSRTFSIDDIKTICINYRLRFLNSKYFKTDKLPHDAASAINILERQLGGKIEPINIMGMAKFSKLEDSGRIPLIFARINKANYYLIYKSGKNVAWYNKLLAYPLRSIMSFFMSFVIIGLPLVFLLPLLIFHAPKDVQTYQMLYLAMFVVSILFFLVFGGVTFYKNFSKVCWNIPTFNSN